MRRFFSCLILVPAVMLAGCNTWAGLGQDVQKVGKKMENQGERKSSD